MRAAEAPCDGRDVPHAWGDGRCTPENVGGGAGCLGRLRYEAEGGGGYTAWRAAVGQDGSRDDTVGQMGRTTTTAHRAGLRLHACWAKNGGTSHKGQMVLGRADASARLANGRHASPRPGGPFIFFLYLFSFRNFPVV
jgi:hypothetical protein